MATFKSDQRTEQENYTKRNGLASFRGLQQEKRSAKFTFSLAGTEANDDLIELGILQVEGAQIIPEETRLVDTGDTGDVDLNAIIEAVADADGTVTALTTAASVDNNAAAFGRLADGSTPAVGAEDLLRLKLSSVEAATASETLAVEVTYVVENFAG